jgi:hypothetical protein
MKKMNGNGGEWGVRDGACVWARACGLTEKRVTLPCGASPCLPIVYTPALRLEGNPTLQQRVGPAQAAGGGGEGARAAAAAPCLPPWSLPALPLSGQRPADRRPAGCLLLGCCSCRVASHSTTAGPGLLLPAPGSGRGRRPSSTARTATDPGPPGRPGRHNRLRVTLLPRTEPRNLHATPACSTGCGQDWWWGWMGGPMRWRGGEQGSAHWVAAAARRRRPCRRP